MRRCASVAPIWCRPNSSRPRSTTAAGRFSRVPCSSAVRACWVSICGSASPACCRRISAPPALRERCRHDLLHPRDTGTAVPCRVGVSGRTRALCLPHAGAGVRGKPHRRSQWQHVAAPHSGGLDPSDRSGRAGAGRQHDPECRHRCQRHLSLPRRACHHRAALRHRGGRRHARAGRCACGTGGAAAAHSLGVGFDSRLHRLAGGRLHHGRRCRQGGGGVSAGHRRRPVAVDRGARAAGAGLCAGAAERAAAAA